jgi:hypothetical protein
MEDFIMPARKKTTRKTTSRRRRSGRSTRFTRNVEPVDTDSDESLEGIRDDVNEQLEASGLPTLDEEDDLDDDEEQTFQSDEEEDVFDFCNNLIQRGRVPIYTIKKNGYFLTTKPHPYSWTELQTEHGPGHYKVMAKDMNTGKYIKQQTQMVMDGGDMREPTHDEENRVEKLEKTASNPMIDFAQLMTMQQQMQAPIQQKIEQERRESEKKSTDTMALMMTMMQNSQQQNMQMMMEMSKSTNAMMAQVMGMRNMGQEDSRNEVMDILKLALTNKGKGGGMDDPLKVLDLVQRHETKGFEMAKLIQDIAEAKAGALSEETEGKSKSMTDRLIETMLPLIAKGAGAGGVSPDMLAAMQAQQTTPPLPARPAQVPSQPARPPGENYRRNLSGTQQPGSTFAGGAQQGNPQAQAASQARPNERAAAPGGRTTGQANPQQGGLPRANFGAKSEIPTPETEITGPEVVEDSTSVMAPEAESLLTVLVPFIGEAIAGGHTPEITANNTPGLLGQAGYDVPTALNIIPKSFMIEVAGHFGMADQHAWLEEYYAHLESSARMDVNGQGQGQNRPDPERSARQH